MEQFPSGIEITESSAVELTDSVCLPRRAEKRTLPIRGKMSSRIVPFSKRSS